ncbi:hypothetical protein [Nostoc sp. LPT]|uniref:hypothetical protein n=1 Tax=Nostoc sp. LPT TaxID=2815387 RepID=UPI001D5E787F|nr:hypothetical protein [Nostoc sp. LPT]MBN4005529.1 hypothetical protein [Nostoc sp. LPT]
MGFRLLWLITRTSDDFVEFLGFINQQLYSKEIERLEVMMMPANFSSMVGEFMISNIPKYCSKLVKKQYHNGHPDLIPAGMFPKNSAQHSHIGIEVKASRYQSGWQGHNPEDTWLLVFVFDISGNLLSHSKQFAYKITDLPIFST